MILEKGQANGIKIEAKVGKRKVSLVYVTIYGFLAPFCIERSEQC